MVGWLGSHEGWQFGRPPYFPSSLELTRVLFITQLSELLHVKSATEKPAGLEVGSGFQDIWIRKLHPATERALDWGPEICSPCSGS